MDAVIRMAQEFGLGGLILISFVESFISPILPDVLLIPMGLANPGLAIYYGAVATAASVAGGFVGYYAGNRLGIPALRRFVPIQHSEKIRVWLGEYGGWAIFFAAMAPIPYKFVCISAGVFRVSFPVFLFASVLGRAKRFLLEGVLIYYYGPVAVDLISEYSQKSLIVLAVAATVFAVWLYRRWRRPAPPKTD